MNLPFLAYPPIEHPVNGVVCKFYPVSSRIVFSLRGVAKPVMKAITSLFVQNGNDIALDSNEIQTAEGQFQKRINQGAISTDLARLRFDQRQASLESLIEGLMADPSANLIADLVMSSMRETYIPKKSPQAFLDETPAPVLMEMLVGVAKANEKLFDPLKQRVASISAILNAKLAQLRGQLDTPSGKSPVETEGTTPSGSS